MVRNQTNRDLFWEPWMEPWPTLFRQINRLWEDMPQNKTNFPPVNIWSTENEAMLQAELPGIDPNAIEINVLQDVVDVRGERKPVAQGEDMVYRRQERSLGSFQRRFRLPFRIDAENVQARYEKGILQLKLPRSKQDMPKQIKVKGS